MASRAISPTPETLRCKKCGADKPLTAFPVAKKYKYGRRQPCTVCTSVRDRGEVSGHIHTRTREEMARRIEQYGFDALDALHQLAMLDIRKKQYRGLAQVKFLAANRLAPQGNLSELGNHADSVIAMLDKEYQRLAPRIKEVRERIITFENGARTIEAESVRPAQLDSPTPACKTASG